MRRALLILSNSMEGIQLQLEVKSINGGIWIFIISLLEQEKHTHETGHECGKCYGTGAGNPSTRRVREWEDKW